MLAAPRGSIAIVGQGIADLDGVAKKVFDAVDWACLSSIARGQGDARRPAPPSASAA